MFNIGDETIDWYNARQNTYSSIYRWIIRKYNVLEFVHEINIESFRRCVRFLRGVRTQWRVLFSTNSQNDETFNQINLIFLDY